MTAQDIPIAKIIFHPSSPLAIYFPTDTSTSNQKTKHVDLAQLAERPLCKRKAKVSITLVYKPP